MARYKTRTYLFGYTLRIGLGIFFVASVLDRSRKPTVQRMGVASGTHLFNCPKMRRDVSNIYCLRAGEAKQAHFVRSEMAKDREKANYEFNPFAFFPRVKVLRGSDPPFLLISKKIGIKLPPKQPI